MRSVQTVHQHRRGGVCVILTHRGSVGKQDATPPRLPTPHTAHKGAECVRSSLIPAVPKRHQPTFTPRTRTGAMRVHQLDELRVVRDVYVRVQVDHEVVLREHRQTRAHLASVAATPKHSVSPNRCAVRSALCSAPSWWSVFCRPNRAPGCIDATGGGGTELATGSGGKTHEP